MQDVRFRIVRSDGEEFNIDNETWMILSDGLENWGTLPVEVKSEEASNIDGGFIQNVRVASIDRTITAQLKDPKHNKEMRRRAISFFSPRFDYTVHATYMGVTRWCTGVQMGFACPTENVFKPVSFTWTLFSSQPFLMSEDDYGKDIAEVIPKFGFPIQSLLSPGTNINGVVQPTGYQTGFITGLHEFGNTINIYNDGDVDTSLRVEIFANDNVVNPKIMKDGKFIRLITTLKKGQLLIIDMTKRPPKVTIDGENSIHLCDRASSFTNMDIELGTNVISYDADEGQQNMSVSVYWNKRYLGL